MTKKKTVKKTIKPPGYVFGRPSKYNAAIQEKADQYLDLWGSLGDVVPSNEALAEYISVAASTIELWGKDPRKKDFSVTLGKIKQKQKRVLINKGLIGDFNSNIVKLMLCNHGMSDKQDVTLGGHVSTSVPLSAKEVENLSKNFNDKF